MRRGILLAAFLPAALAAAASAGPVLKVECPEGVYHQKPFAFTVDLGSGEVTAGSLDMQIIPGGLADKTITFGYMRGNAVFHRDTHVLEWDARGQYDHNAGLGYPGAAPRDSYMGSAVCTVAETR